MKLITEFVFFKKKLGANVDRLYACATVEMRREAWDCSCKVEKGGGCSEDNVHGILNGPGDCCCRCLLILKDALN